MRVTTKGQVTIPLAVRELLGIEPGSEVEFEVDKRDGRVNLAKVHDAAGAAEVFAMRERAKGRVTMSTDEILALTRDDVD